MNFMKRYICWRRSSPRASCSTLRRVEPYATFSRPLTIIFEPFLQYPQTGRTLCNLWCHRAKVVADQFGRTLRRRKPYEKSKKKQETLPTTLLENPQRRGTLGNFKKKPQSTVPRPSSNLRR